MRKLFIALCMAVLISAFGVSALEYLDLNTSTVGLYDNFNRPDGVVGTLVYPSYTPWSVGGDGSALISNEALDINLAGANYALIWPEFYTVNTSHTVTWELDVNPPTAAQVWLTGVAEWGTQGNKMYVSAGGGVATCVIADSDGNGNSASTAPVAIASGMQHWKIIFTNEASPENYSISAYQDGTPICEGFSAPGFPQYMKDANYITFAFIQFEGETIVDNYLVYNGTVQPYSSMGVPPLPPTGYAAEYTPQNFVDIIIDFLAGFGVLLKDWAKLFVLAGVVVLISAGGVAIVSTIKKV